MDVWLLIIKMPKRKRQSSKKITNVSKSSARNTVKINISDKRAKRRKYTPTFQRQQQPQYIVINAGSQYTGIKDQREANPIREARPGFPSPPSINITDSSALTKDAIPISSTKGKSVAASRVSPPASIVSRPASDEMPPPASIVSRPASGEMPSPASIVSNPNPKSASGEMLPPASVTSKQNSVKSPIIPIEIEVAKSDDLSEMSIEPDVFTDEDNFGTDDSPQREQTSSTSALLDFKGLKRTFNQLQDLIQDMNVFVSRYELGRIPDNEENRARYELFQKQLIEANEQEGKMREITDMFGLPITDPLFGYSPEKSNEMYSTHTPNSSVSGSLLVNRSNDTDAGSDIPGQEEIVINESDSIGTPGLDNVYKTESPFQLENPADLDPVFGNSFGTGTLFNDLRQPDRASTSTTTPSEPVSVAPVEQLENRPNIVTPHQDEYRNDDVSNTLLQPNRRNEMPAFLRQINAGNFELKNTNDRPQQPPTPQPGGRNPFLSELQQRAEGGNNFLLRNTSQLPARPLPVNDNNGLFSIMQNRRQRIQDDETVSSQNDTPFMEGYSDNLINRAQNIQQRPNENLDDMTEASWS